MGLTHLVKADFLPKTNPLDIIVKNQATTTKKDTYVHGDELFETFSANYSLYKKDFTATQEKFEKLAQNDVSPYSLKGYIVLQAQKNNFEAISQLIPKLDQFLGQDPEIGLIFAVAEDHTGRSENAQKRLITLNDQLPTNQEIATQTVNVYLRRKEPENALIVIDKLLNNAPRRPYDFFFHFTKAQIFLGMNKKKEALASINTSLSLYPQRATIHDERDVALFDKGHLMKALLEEQQGNINEAIKGYTTYLTVGGVTGTDQNKDIEQHVLQLTIKQKMAHNNKNNLITMKPCIENALTLFNEKKFKDALDQINKCLETRPNDKEASIMKIKILSALNNNQELQTMLTDLLVKSPDSDSWFRMLHMLTHEHISPSEAITLLHTVEQKRPKSLFVHLYLADFYTRVENIDQALIYHTKTLALTSDLKLKTKILFQTGLIYYQKKEYQAMCHALDESKKLSPDFPPTNNLLSYYYATQGKDVEKAFELITRALKKDPLNPHYLDTQALVYYKQKKYTQSQEILEKIVHQEPKDSLIHKHLAKVLYKTGHNQKALKHLKNAISLTNSSQEKTKYQKLYAQWSSKIS